MLNFKYDITVLVTVQINGLQPFSTFRPSLSIYFNLLGKAYICHYHFPTG